MELRTIDIVIIIMLGFLLTHVIVNTWNNKENFTEHLTDDNTASSIRQAVKEVYQVDVEAIKNLGEIAKQLQEGGKVIIPGGIVVRGDLEVEGDSNLKKKLTVSNKAIFNNDIDVKGTTNLRSKLAMNDNEILLRGMRGGGNHYIKYDNSIEGPHIKGLKGVKLQDGGIILDSNKVMKLDNNIQLMMNNSTKPFCSAVNPYPLRLRDKDAVVKFNRGDYGPCYRAILTSYNKDNDVLILPPGEWDLKTFDMNEIVDWIRALNTVDIYKNSKRDGKTDSFKGDKELNKTNVGKNNLSWVVVHDE